MSVNISPTSVTLKVGDEATFSGFTSQSGSIIWAGSPEGVFVIENATGPTTKVKAVGPGSATLTAENSQGETATATVTVTG